MQIGVGGAAGNIFVARGVDGDGDGHVGAHDPADAIATAAIILIKDKGAPVGAPIDAYRTAVRAYNGTGPAADAYADRVLADAHLYAPGANLTNEDSRAVVGGAVGGHVGDRLAETAKLPKADDASTVAEARLTCSRGWRARVGPTRSALRARVRREAPGWGSQTG